MRPPFLRAAFAPDELVIDNFAGGGGASAGIEAAIGRPVDIAINHDAEAIAMHQANHPETKHYREDVWAVDPREACGSRRVALVWFSPACTNFSRAKGGANPLSAKIRSLAWVVIRWAKAVHPRTIILENVEEFEDWGPLNEKGRPIPERKGDTFRSWLAQLTECGYRVEFRSLVAADYGAPTTRKRLFLVATLGNGQVVWPEPTHGAGRAESWRPAADVIDWNLPVRSIFGRKKPLAEATLKRIALGIERYVLKTASPFMIPCTHQGDARTYSIEEPLRTITGAHRGEFAVVEPYIVRHGHYSHRSGAGLREGCGAGLFRGQPLDTPLATVCATNDKHLIAPVVIKHYGGQVGHGVERPIGTVTARDHHALAAAFCTKFYGTSIGSSVTEPLPTITSGGGHGGGHIAEVRAFLTKFYGASGRFQGQAVDTPLHTVTTKARFGLGIVMLGDEPYRIVDIGMRMLQPHELFRAQGFPEWYEIAPTYKGKPLTKTAQTRLCGNSVSPPPAEALVSANVVRRAA